MPVNAVIFPNNIPSAITNFHPFQCYKKKTMHLQKKNNNKHVRLKSHFEALLLGGNISSRPEGQREERGWGAGRQAAACPQDTHKYPCKLQFKRNQYKWQVANATIWGSNEGVLALVCVVW